jgi:hypothetical protein
LGCEIEASKITLRMWPEQLERWSDQHNKRKTVGGASFRDKVRSSLLDVLSLRVLIRHSSGDVE